MHVAERKNGGYCKSEKGSLYDREKRKCTFMSLNQKIKAAKIGYISISALLCVLGVVLIAVPDLSAGFLCKLCGVLLILFGAVKILGYFSRDLYRLAFQHDLAFGILLIALGVILISRTGAAISVLCTMLGIYVLADGLLKIQVALDAKHFGLPKWWMILTSAILVGIVGFLLIFRPWEGAQALMILLGISLITEGVMNLITILTAVKLFRNIPPTVIDADMD